MAPSFKTRKLLTDIDLNPRGKCSSIKKTPLCERVSGYHPRMFWEEIVSRVEPNVNTGVTSEN